MENKAKNAAAESRAAEDDAGGKMSSSTLASTVAADDTMVASATVRRKGNVDVLRRSSVDSRMEGLVLHEDESGGKQGEYADPSPSSSTIRPKRRMSRRYSMHQRNESAPDFFNDIDADDLKKAFAIDVDDAGASGSNDRRQSPAASAVFSIDGTNPVPKPASEVRVKRTQHSRRRSESSDEWEIGLRNALNLEVSKFKSEENKKKMKATYKRALMPRGMLKIPGSPAMRQSVAKTDQTRVASQSNKKEERRASSATGDLHVKPKSLDMDALIAAGEVEAGSALRPIPRSALAGGHRRMRSNASDCTTTSHASAHEQTPIALPDASAHARTNSSELLGTSQSNSEEGDEAGGASIVINDVDDNGVEGEKAEGSRDGDGAGGETGEEEHAELTPLQRLWHRILVCFFHLHTSIIFQVVVLLSSVVALLAADVSLLSFHRSTESFVDALLGCSACFLFLDLLVCLHIRRGYSYTILSLMDFIAVLSIVIEIRWVFQVLLIFFAKTESFENFFSVMSEIAESARLTNAPKILRIALQLFSHCFDIEGYVADVNYIIGEDEATTTTNVQSQSGVPKSGAPVATQGGRKDKGEPSSDDGSDDDAFAKLKIVLPDDLKAGSLRTLEDEDDGSRGGSSGMGMTRDRSETQLSMKSVSSDESDYEYEDEDNDSFVFRQEEHLRNKLSSKHSPGPKGKGGHDAAVETAKNRAKIPGSTLILAVDKIASPWLHEIGTVVLEFMTARMVLMLLLFMLIVRLLQNNKPSNQKELGLRVLDGIASVDPSMNSTAFSIALHEYTLRYEGTDKKGTFYNKDQPLAYLRINGVDLLDAVDVRTLYGRREDELSYTILRGVCAKPAINERFARLVILRECRSIAVWDNRRILARTATNNILKTVFITCTLALGMFMIGYDLNVLVLDPIDSIYQMGKEMLFSINWGGIGEAMKAAEVDDRDEDLDEHQRNVRKIARHIIMAGDLFVRSKPLLNEQFVSFRSTAADLDARYGKNKEDLVPAVDGIIHNINPTVDAVKLIVDGVDAVMVPAVGDIDIYAPARRDSTDIDSGRGGPLRRQRRNTSVHNDARLSVARPTHGYHRAQRRESSNILGRSETMVPVNERRTTPNARSSGLSLRRPQDRFGSPARRASYTHDEYDTAERSRATGLSRLPTRKGAGVFRRKQTTGDLDLLSSPSRRTSFSSTPPSSRHNSVASSPNPGGAGDTQLPRRRSSRGSRSMEPRSLVDILPPENSSRQTSGAGPSSDDEARMRRMISAPTSSTAPGSRAAAPPPPPRSPTPIAAVMSPDVRSSLSTLDRALDLLNDETFEKLEEGSLV